jgi:hypothetical protein
MTLIQERCIIFFHFSQCKINVHLYFNNNNLKQFEWKGVNNSPFTVKYDTWLTASKLKENSWLNLYFCLKFNRKTFSIYVHHSLFFFNPTKQVPLWEILMKNKDKSGSDMLRGVNNFKRDWRGGFFSLSCFFLSLRNIDCIVAFRLRLR